jgi:hypothetical protein
VASQPADDVTVWLFGLQWVEAAWMQATRLSDVVQAWFAALTDARLRASLNEDRDNARAWREATTPTNHMIHSGRFACPRSPYGPKCRSSSVFLSLPSATCCERRSVYRRNCDRDDRPTAVSSDAEHCGALG